MWEINDEPPRDAAKSLVQLHGYDCKTVKSMYPYIFGEGFTAYCNKCGTFLEIENHGAYGRKRQNRLS